MITSVHNKADLLITPRKGGEPDKAAATRPAAARTQPDSPHDASRSTDRAALDRAAAQFAALARELFQYARRDPKLKVLDVAGWYDAGKIDTLLDTNRLVKVERMSVIAP